MPIAAFFTSVPHAEVKATVCFVQYILYPLYVKTPNKSETSRIIEWIDQADVLFTTNSVDH